MSAADDSGSLHDSVSATNLTVGTTNSVTDFNISSCDPENALYQQLRIRRAVLWYLLLVYIIKPFVHPIIVPTRS